MPIILSENFQNDTPESIIRRYPGTVRVPADTDIANAFPINRGSVLQLGTIPFTEANNRFEIRLDFANTGTGGLAANFFLFGIVVSTASSPTIAGVPWSVSDTMESMNIIVERSGSALHLIVLIDGEVVITPTIIDPPVFTSWIGGNIPGNASKYANWPSHITSIVVAVDTPAGTRLGAPTFTNRALSVVDSGDWQFTDVGFVQDVDKADPSQMPPNVSSNSAPSLVYEIDGDIDGSHIKLYTGGSTDIGGRTLEINGSVLPVDTEPRGNVILPASKQISVNIVDTGAVANNDGLVFLGERSNLITYNNFCTAVGFTAGTLNTAAGTNSWLEFILDGKRLIVSKIPVRYSVTWNQIYAAGLVYGTDDFGLNPTGTPVNQLKTIELEGNTYKVRLLKGTDTDPYYGVINTNDPAGSRRSEWARLFYPICSASVPSYTGPKLASYTEAQLGVGGSLSGRQGWCQETRGLFLEQRIFLGSSGISYLTAASSGSGGGALGYRPCLELI